MVAACTPRIYKDKACVKALKISYETCTTENRCGVDLGLVSQGHPEAGVG